MKRDEENVEQVFGFDRPLTLPLPFDHSCQALGTHAGMIFILDVEETWSKDSDLILLVS